MKIKMKIPGTYKKNKKKIQAFLVMQSVYIHTVCAIPPGSYNLRQKSMLKVKKSGGILIMR